MFATDNSITPRPQYSGDALPKDKSWKCVAIVVDGAPDKAARSLALDLAKRDGARVILYDVSAWSFWTSPLSPEVNVSPFLFGEADLRRVGRDALAESVRDLERADVQVGAHLATKRHANDLAERVRAEGIDLVICPIAFDGSSLRSIHRSRENGAYLLECPPGKTAVVHRPIRPDDTVPSTERVQSRFLVGLIVTFIIAALRNRSAS